MKRSVQMGVWIVAVAIAAGAVFAGVGFWKSGSAKRSPEEVFQAYFEAKSEDVKNISAAGSVWNDAAPQIIFTSEARVRLQEEIRYHEVACTEKMLLAFALKSDPANQRCFAMEDGDSFLIHIPATGEHYFYAAE